MERIIAEGRKDGGTPLVEASVKMMFFAGNSPPEFLIILAVPRIKAAVADHFIMLFRDMPDQTLYELHDRDGFLDIFVILMPVVMESDKITIVVVNPGGGDDRPSEIAAHIFDDCFWVTGIGFGINVEAIFVIAVAEGLNFFKRGSDLSLQFIEKRGTESVAEESIVEIFYITPETVIAVTAFGNETVDVRVPLEVPAEGMEDHNKAGSEVHGFILLKKQA